jgi:hypothetical protein
MGSTDMRTLILSTLLLAACTTKEAPTGGMASQRPDDGSGGSAGAPSQGGGGSGGSGGAKPEEHHACQGDAAFWATGMSFTEPTAYGLANVFQASLWGYDGHGVSVVVTGDSISTSATAADEQGVHHFLDAPTFTAVLRDAGGVRTDTPQATAWLRLEGAEPTLIELRNVMVQARATDDCSQLFVVLDAVIPVEEGDLVVTTPQGDETTIAELAGGSDSGTLGWPIRALFQGEAILFDFAGAQP